MTGRYVVAYDGSPAGRRAVDFAVALAGATGAEIVVAHVLDWSPYSFLTREEIAERHKRREEELARARSALLAPLTKALRAGGTEVETEIRYGKVVDTLLAIARDHRAAQIVTGRTGEAGPANRLFGSVAGTLAQVSPVPVTIVP